MNLLAIDSFWKVENDTLVAKSGSSLSDLLLAEMGVKREINALEKAAADLAKPEEAIKNYNNELTKIANDVVPTVQKTYKKLIKLGYPSEFAQDYALEDGKTLYNSKKKLVKLNYPLMGDPEVMLSSVAKVDLRSKGARQTAVVPKVAKRKVK